MTNGLWSDPHTARMEPDNNKNKVRDYRQFVKRSHSWDDGELPVLFDAANTPYAFQQTRRDCNHTSGTVHGSHIGPTYENSSGWWLP